MTTWIVTDELDSNEMKITPEMWMNKLCSRFNEAIMVSKYKGFTVEQLQGYMRESMHIELVVAKAKPSNQGFDNSLR